MKKLLEINRRIVRKIKQKYYSLVYYIFKPKYGLNKEEKRDKKVIVSLTSYPARFSAIHICLSSLLNQTYKPDKIILYLGEDSAEVDITEKMKELEKYGVEIKMGCENIRPHKKYYYAMKEYPNDIIITVDDDVIYDRRLIESLIKSYYKHPNAVSARRVHRMTKSHGKLQSYNNWDFECTLIREPSMDLMAVGVGGILYPPACMNEELFNLVCIKQICLNADDIWLKFMQVMNDTPVVWVDSVFIHPVEIKNTQETALNSSNLNESKNDFYIQKMEESYGVKLVEYVK